MNRRDLIRSTAVLVPAAFVPKLLMAQFPVTTGYPSLNATIVNSSQSATVNLCRAAVARTASGATIQAAATSLSTLFEHFTETGWNPIFSNNVISGISSRLSSGISDGPRMVARLATVGIEAVANNYNIPAFALNAESLSNSLSTNGVAYIQAQLMIALNQGISKAETTGNQNISDSPTFPRARLRSIVEFPANPQVPTLKFGCGPDGLVTSILAVFSPPPIDIIFGALGIAYGVLDYFNLC